MSSRIIWCLGMYASASTWMLNVVREIMVASGPSDVAVQFVRERIDMKVLERANTVNIVKSHEVSDEIALLALAARADTILMTVRDPRDAVASMMEYQNMNFPKAAQLVKESGSLCRAFLKDRRTTCFAFENRFFDDRTTVLKLARIMGRVISEPAARACFDRSSRPAVEQLIGQLPNRSDILFDPISGDFLDPRTQWHTHHAGRSAEIGRWRHKLSPQQVRELQALSDFID